MIVSRLLPKLKTSMQKRPLLFNSIIYGSFYTGAEFAQQTYNRVFKTPVSDKPKTACRLDGDCMVCIRRHEYVGLLSICRIRYKWLDTFYKGKTMKVILIKLFTDQFILTPPLIVVFFLSMSLMEGKLDVFYECQVKFLQTFKTSCMYWLPVQFLNFLLIPPALRVSYVSVAAFCWVNILCYLKSAPLSKCDQNNPKIK